MFNFGNIIGSVAPVIGKAIMGDFGGAINVGLEAFGITPSGNKKNDKNTLERAIRDATPDQLLKLKIADNEFELNMVKIGIDIEKIAADDRSSARIMKIETGNIMTDIIGVGIMMGFFFILYFMFSNPDSSNRALDIMLGSLGTMATAVVTFYFGSSAGSRKKDDNSRKAT